MACVTSVLFPWRRLEPPARTRKAARHDPEGRSPDRRLAVTASRLEKHGGHLLGGAGLTLARRPARGLPSAQILLALPPSRRRLALRGDLQAESACALSRGPIASLPPWRPAFFLGRSCLRRSSCPSPVAPARRAASSPSGRIGCWPSRLPNRAPYPNRQEGQARETR
jgi:hypothetical protein